MSITHKVKRDVKKVGKKEGMLELDIHTTLLAQLEALTKELVGAPFIPVNVSLV